MRYSKLAVICAISGLLVLATVPPSQAQQGANFQWDGVAVKDALSALSRQYQINYSLPDELGQKKISASLVNATPQEALRTILDAANLTAVNDGGVWRIREKAERGGGERAWPQQQGLPQPVYGGAGAAGYQQPVPFRQPPSQVERGVGAAAEQAAIPEEWDVRNWVTRIIPIRFVDPWLLVDIFGGTAVSEESSGGGYGGYSGRGGYDRGGYDRGYDRGGYDRGGYDRGYDRGRSSYDRGSDRGRSSYDRGYRY